MTHRFHIHWSPKAPGLLDAFSRPVTAEEVGQTVLSLPLLGSEAAGQRVLSNLEQYLARFTDRLPVRVPARHLLSGLPSEFEQRLAGDDALGSFDYEPAYGEDIARLRRQLDDRIQYAGPVAERLTDITREATLDMLEARNQVLHYIMSSTFRIVISRLMEDGQGEPWLVITARDTDRQDETRLEVTVCRATGPSSFEYYGGEEVVPSSSLESHWHCHHRLAATQPERSHALLHCHAREVLAFASAARDAGSSIDEQVAQIATVEGVSRLPSWGLSVAQAMEKGSRIVFRPGEGIWVGGTSAIAAAKEAIEIISRLPMANIGQGAGVPSVPSPAV